MVFVFPKARILLLFFLAFLLAPKILFSQQVPKLEWQKCLGGTGFEVGNCIIQTTDGGYAIAAYATSNDGDVSGNHGRGDAWIVKLDVSGNIKWEKSLGGSEDDYASWIIQTSDGGYAIAGRTGSTDGDISGYHGGDYDAWIIKLDSSGNVIWKKCFGGSSYDQANYITRTTDGGYVFCGVSYSHDGDITGNHDGPGDAWIVKLDSLGNIKWQKCYGGSGNDEAISIIQTSNGGYAIAGRTGSSDGDISGYQGGDFDGFVLTLDSSGNMNWMKCYGGDSIDHFHSIIQTEGGGFVVAGHTSSANGDVIGYHGDEDARIIKIDSSGNLQWQRCLGGSGDEGIYSIVQSADKGYVAAGWSSSSDGDVSGGHGVDDIWFVKLNSDGNIEWQECLGGSKSENANSMVITSDGGYAIAGFTNSNDGNITGNHGGEDAWIVKLSRVNTVSQPLPSSHFFSFYPNPAIDNEYITYILDARSHSTIELYNLLGERMKILLDELEDAGTYQKQFDLHSLSNGSYIIQFIIDGHRTMSILELLR